MDNLPVIIDKLTGIYNHRYFQETIEAEFRKSYEDSRPLSLMLIDIDSLQRFNYDYGHVEGDNLLIRVGEITKNFLRDTDILCRYGGDEFAVICINTEKKEALLMAENIRQSVEDYDFISENKPVKMTVSIGLSVFPYDCDTKTKLIWIADENTYLAKKGGRNRIFYKI